ncbi:Bro-N domain-containing protein [Paenibacillus sp. FSL H8-0332]|uniref:BRO-N domain-containing protein n=1 Tax=Paenibacillus sp. FSL H8-0332 TaxID=2954742 RepID=UPI0030CF8CD9
MIDNQPWFNTKDVCDILEHSDTSMAVKRLDDDEKMTQTMFVSGQNRLTWLVNEYGLYSLIMKSRKPEAKVFKKWITHEVIPSIRKSGI